MSSLGSKTAHCFHNCGFGSLLPSPTFSSKTPGRDQISFLSLFLSRIPSTSLPPPPASPLHLIPGPEMQWRKRIATQNDTLSNGRERSEAHLLPTLHSLTPPSRPRCCLHQLPYQSARALWPHDRNLYSHSAGGQREGVSRVDLVRGLSPWLAGGGFHPLSSPGPLSIDVSKTPVLMTSAL
jgi:hypothetical protein